MTAAFIAGCDGATSTVREIMGTGFPGGTYPQIFYVADVEGEGRRSTATSMSISTTPTFSPFSRWRDKGRVRLIGAIKPGDEQRRRQTHL